VEVVMVVMVRVVGILVDCTMILVSSSLMTLFVPRVFGCNIRQLEVHEDGCMLNVICMCLWMSVCIYVCMRQYVHGCECVLECACMGGYMGGTTSLTATAPPINPHM